MKTELVDKLDYRFKWLNNKEVWCGDGWYKLMWDFMEELEEHYKLKNEDINTLCISQIKEKYGTLRIYVSNYIDGVYEIIEKYEDKSEVVCDICGEHGSLHIKNGWVKTLCKKCAAEQEFTETT